ncbi:rhodanese-like domain-containing protein [Clostridium psychrophilum]|uniref:rhodanese-like domain-containing protein n=1 Tax=Clostridium psychrophilum TaxID=132926 RepID=UPI001C0BD671|nr:rhodanese-like domain-containing protein [Clostridium psychrophilum]MBU3182705.1 rhodanese-like domain-containing protein [Clostridium psychrophilum]
MFNSKVKNVTAEEAYKLISDNKDFIILDVRTKDEYDNGHIPGAKLAPVNILSMKLAQLNKYRDKPVLVYCASGGRSPRAVDTLVNNDFKNIYHLSRGIFSWRYSLAR